MEVAGVVAAGITFGATILKLSRGLHKSAKKIRYARRELMELVKEMGIFADLYEDFYRVCVSEQRKKGRNTSSTRHLIDWIQDATDAFRVLLKRVRALAGDSRNSMLETLTAHVKWVFSENEVKYLRMSLSVARESIRGFSNVTLIETINKEIEMIRAAIAQGNQQAIQALEGELGGTLEERLSELEQTSLNRHRLRRAIDSSIQEAAEVLEQQSMRISDSAIVPESNQLFAFATVVEEYAKKVRKQRRTATTHTVHSRQQPARADSFRQTNSTASGSFVSKPSSNSETVAIALSATSSEDIDEPSTTCGRCTGVCICSEVEPHPAHLAHPSSPDINPLPRPAGFEHPSHCFDRSWQQPQSNETAYQSTKSARPATDHDPYKSWQTSKEPVNPDPETQRIMENPNDLVAVIEADRPNTGRSNSSQGSDEEEQEFDDTEEEDEASEGEDQPSFFQPIAGVRGKFPRHWRNRHERSESADDHWK